MEGKEFFVDHHTATAITIHDGTFLIQAFHGEQILPSDFAENIILR